MYSLELLLTAGLTALIAGLVAGYVIAQRSGSSQQSRRQLESQLQELQQQAHSYQQEVTEHFNDTATLLNQLTDSYRDVHKHLAKGAQTLAADSNVKSTLKMIATEDDTDNSDLDQTHITPPLDYAPKTTATGPGILNEEYGLDKTITRDEPAAKEAK